MFQTFHTINTKFTIYPEGGYQYVKNKKIMIKYKGKYWEFKKNIYNNK